LQKKIREPTNQAKAKKQTVPLCPLVEKRKAGRQPEAAKEVPKNSMPTEQTKLNNNTEKEKKKEKARKGARAITRAKGAREGDACGTAMGKRVGGGG